MYADDLIVIVDNYDTIESIISMDCGEFNYTNFGLFKIYFLEIEEKE